MASLEERFWAKVDRRGPDECWLWMSPPDAHGYGQIREGGRRDRTLKAHQVSLQLAGVEIPEGLEPDHTCRNKMCVNPAHLELVTHAENMRRARRESCRRGHRFDEQNTYWLRGKRYCRACKARWMRECYQPRAA